MKCENGHDMPAGAKFCPTCGSAASRVVDAAPTETVAPVASPAAATPSAPKRARAWYMGLSTVWRVVIPVVIAFVVLGAIGSATEKKDDAKKPRTAAAGATTTTEKKATSTTEKATTTTVKRTTTTTEKPTTTTTARPAPAPIHFEGSSQTATDLFPAEGGLGVFNMAHNGGSNFAVWLVTDQGEKVELLANTIGGYQGSYGMNLPAGQWRLDVSADGPWTIDFLQPRPTSGDPIPHEYSGGSDGLVGPFEAHGGVRFEMSHQGDGNFAVWSLHEDGRTRDLLANEIGPFNGSTIENFDGLYWLRVSANGPWTIRLGE